MGTETKMHRLLTTTDLAERWSCDEATVLEHVRLDGLTFIPVGKRPSDRSRPGPKSYRFRLADVENWEEQRRMSWGAATEATLQPAAVAPKASALGVPGWDGKQRGGGNRRSKPAP